VILPFPCAYSFHFLANNANFLPRHEKRVARKRGKSPPREAREQRKSSKPAIIISCDDEYRRIKVCETILEAKSCAEGDVKGVTMFENQ
jgi:hypothetical protein